ncbi:hypothetical protein PsYK624_131860 [Phanerochaete sordida]|uniref:Uncharacterized protein n=1 Tax=Phanerochaete sordida TaxID=48140 RepID=A0A9P3GLJ3_9APHY|nr:hypothetical protein PsYK624_131860 [Phanerochaete sordida]
MHNNPSLPAEVWLMVVDDAVHSFLDEYWTCPLNAWAPDAEPLLPPSPVPNLLAASSTIRHATLRVLAQHLGLKYGTQGIGSLDGNPFGVSSAVRKLWHPENLEKQNAEVERLCQLSSTLDAYAHIVAALQQSRALLFSVLDIYRLEGRSHLERLAQDAEKSKLLLDSAGAHCSSAAARIIRKKLEKLDAEELTGPLVVPYMLRNLAGVVRYLHILRFVCVIDPQLTGIPPPAYLSAGTWEDAISGLLETLVLLLRDLELLLKMTPHDIHWVTWRRLFDMHSLMQIKTVLENARIILRRTSRNVIRFELILILSRGVQLLDTLIVRQLSRSNG